MANGKTRKRKVIQETAEQKKKRIKKEKAPRK